MKKTTGLLYLLAFSVFTIYSCGGGAGSDPKAVVIEFGKRMAKKDFEGAAKLTSEESQPMMKMMIEGMKLAEKYQDKAEKNPMEEFDKAEFGDAKIDGDKATVSVKMKDEKNAVDIPLIKEKGSWKIHFTKETMMSMAKQQGEDINVDDMEKGLDAMKNIDPEQMKKAMEMAQEYMKDPEKMKAIQELLKSADPEKAKELEEALKQMSPEKMKEMQDAMKAMADSLN
ncbi:MAG TPA: hypothetical protein VHM26_01450 [Chitinophagaceae bacterium]|jgi:hypothetical protein|nr:hypothetical protein [Chitinophagaceae bacterium]